MLKNTVLDKFIVTNSFMVIYYLMLMVIFSYFELHELAKLIWLMIIYTVFMLVILLYYPIFRFNFNDIVGNNISLFLIFFSFFWDLGVVEIFILETCQLFNIGTCMSCKLYWKSHHVHWLILYFVFSFVELNHLDRCSLIFILF